MKDAKDFLLKIQKNKDALQVSEGLLNDILRHRKNVLDLNIAVALDVSGSISKAQFSQFMAQLDAIKGISRVKVLETDTQVVAMYDYYQSQPTKIARLKGGGGTEFTPAFRKLKQLQPDAILFMTDGEVYGSIPDPGIPVGWILTKGGTKPFSFGEVVVRLP